ncbi:calcium-binding protein [Limnoraphis robusta Tam1]|uniref:calcium-binding protein n=1 Tax=Limnoraphis robusta TaxID=1118279 RepID=UPI002B204189|nr:calcium-binding protein [Limnoraphis robusta]MEA5539711.1 calcium-binding protein [Limnoraphis robusta Tam1]
MAFTLVPLGFVGFFGFPVLGGTDDPDTIFLSPGQGLNTEILLLRGNDSLQAPNTNERLVVNGNQGDDTITGGSSDDSLFGGTDGDRIFGGSGQDQIFGNVGNDILEGGSSNDLIYGGQGEDNLFGDEGDDTLFGDRGNDILDGNTGVDDLIGGEGDDTFVFNPNEASSDFRQVDAIFQGFVVGNSSLVGDKIAVPSRLRNQIDPLTLERDFDANGDGNFNDIAIQLFDGRYLGIIIDDGTLPNRLDLNIDFVFSDSFF